MYTKNFSLLQLEGHIRNRCNTTKRLAEFRNFQNSHK